ncbi:NB-ARC domain containing protein, partial [Parasponia andersonii]
MAEGVLFSVAEQLLVMFRSPVLEEIGLIHGVNDEHRKLVDKTEAIRLVLLDAEEKMDVDDQVKNWLKKLGDVFFYADDVVDEFRTEALRRRVMSGNKFTRQVCSFFSSSNQLLFKLKMGHRIKDINKRLDEIAKNKDNFCFTSRQVEPPVSTGSGPRETCSVVGEVIIGRDDDKKAIIDQLLMESKSEENVSVIPIVGIGGLGKTTLVQYVFNDEKVESHFQLKMWVCVSDVFDVKLLVGKIIRSASSKKLGDLELEPLQKKLCELLNEKRYLLVGDLELELLQKKLCELLNEKRYLLVLDDVWNEDSDQWLKLKGFLKVGARGSRVLVTTRNERVANITRTVESFKLSGLSEDKSWSLFKKMTFEEGREPSEGSKIEGLGREVVEKCKGVPLAIRTIGRLLQSRIFMSQNTEKELLWFRNNELAKIAQQDNDILPTLKLSYSHLPSHLKHCFAYCRLFPKDHVINVKDLIKLWMAQGFIKCSNQNQCLEDDGYEHFMNLLWRSFFQEPEHDEFGDVRTCKMHDLMHDLAISVAGTD